MTSPITLPVAGFRAEAVLDQDRMATVWLAADERGRSAVLSIWHRALVSDNERTSYLGWATSLSRAGSARGIADVLAAGLTDDGRPYLAVETRPSTLAERLAEAALTPSMARNFGLDLAEGLAVVHDAGVVHGAVRPATVLDASDHVALSGFGITAPVVAQPLPVDAYTPPEHIGEAIAGQLAASPGGDVYDLALTLYIALGGRAPWIDEPTSASLRAQLLPAIPGVAHGFIALLRTATSVEPDARPTATVFSQMLEELDPGEGGDPLPNVDLAELVASYVRRVAVGALDAAAGAFGGAAGAVAAARVFGEPAATGPAPVAASASTPAPPTPTPPTSSPPSPTAPGTSGGGSAGGTGVPLAVKAVVVMVTAAVVAGGAWAFSQRGGDDDGPSTVNAADDSDGAPEQRTGESVVLEPERIDFGMVSLGGEVAATVTFTNRGAETVTPDVAVVTGEGFIVKSDTCAGQPIVPGGTCTLTVALHPVLTYTYGGELTVPTGGNDVTVPLAGVGVAADLAGSYSLTRTAVDPPAPPGDSGNAAAWEGSVDAVDELVGRALTIETQPGCSSPPCPHIINLAVPRPLDPIGDGTFQGSEGDGVDGITWTVRPDAVEGERVVSLTLTISQTVLGFTITHTLTGTRTA